MQKHNLLDGKVVLITGATSGIGMAAARAFAQKDGYLVLVGRNMEKLEELAGELVSKYDVGVHTVELDVRNREDVLEKLDKLPRIWKRVDVLVNNAGLGQGHVPLQDLELDDMETVIDTNLKGLLYVTKAILPGMIDRGRGHVINLGSVLSHEVVPRYHVYTATKHAVLGLSKSMRLDLMGTNVRVTTISPGTVRTRFAETIRKGDAESAEQFYAMSEPLEAEDIAEAIVWSASQPPRVNVDEIVIYPTQQPKAGVVEKK